MKLISVPFALAVLLASLGAPAQGLDDGTYDVYNQDILVEGKLEGCSLVFTAITTDTAYLGGTQVLLNGSVALRTLGRQDLLFTGKLGTRRILQSGPGEWEQPVYFHFFGDKGGTAGAAKFAPAENPGYRLLIGRATDERIMGLIEEMAEKGEFSVGFNRVAGGQDVLAKVKMNVRLERGQDGGMRRVQSNDTPLAYSRCVTRLIDDLAKRLGGK